MENNTKIFLGASVLAVIGYLYFKNKKDSELVTEQTNEGGLGGGGGGFGLGAPNTILINKSKEKDKLAVESSALEPTLSSSAMPAPAPLAASSGGSVSIGSSASSDAGTSGSALASTSGRVAPPTVWGKGVKVSVIDRPTDVQYRNRNGAQGSNAMTSSFAAFYGF